MLTKDTNLGTGAGVTARIQFECTYQILSLVDQMGALISEVDESTETIGPCAIMRALVARIKSLNSVLMSSLDDSDGLTLQGGIQKLYCNDQAGFLDQLIDDEKDERNYVAGRDLAVAMIEAGREFAENGGSDLCELDGSYRPGSQQNNFAFAFLCKLQGQRDQMQGFAAVLSAMLGELNTSGTIPISDYAQTPYSRMFLSDMGRGDQGELISLKPAEKARQPETAEA